MPEEGLTFDKLLQGQDINIDKMMQHLADVAAKAGLPFHPPAKAYCTHLAQEMGKWAERLGRGDEFRRAIFHAYFVESKNISDPSTLIAIAGSMGLPTKQAQETITRRTFQKEVDEDWSYSKKMNVTVAPTFLLNKNRLVGAQSNEAFTYFLANNLPPDP